MHSNRLCQRLKNNNNITTSTRRKAKVCSSCWIKRIIEFTRQSEHNKPDMEKVMEGEASQLAGSAVRGIFTRYIMSWNLLLSSVGGTWVSSQWVMKLLEKRDECQAKQLIYCIYREHFFALRSTGSRSPFSLFLLTLQPIDKHLISLISRRRSDSDLGLCAGGQK